MMKVHLVYLALCSLTQAVYISRMSTVNRMRIPTAFRPGVSLQRPWSHPRLVPAASHRSPYVLVRNPPQRYAIKHYGPSTRNVFNGNRKTTARLPSSAVTSEYEYIKAAPSVPVVHSDGGTGAIHTIPAPNLSLSEKPIVVIETSDNPTSDQPRPSYEVTERYPENEFNARLEAPIDYSKDTSFLTPELQTLVRNGAALQVASEYSLPAISINGHHLPQQYPMQGISNFQSHRDSGNIGAEGIFISPNAIYQTDPMFLQKLQNQLLQRFQAVEFIPYSADVPNQMHLQPQASQNHPQIILLENEQLVKPLNPMPEPEQKNIVQRETQEDTVVTFVPHPFVVTNNTTEKPAENKTSPQPHNFTLELVTSESQPVTTTIKYVVESNFEKENTTPIYYAQVGQSVGSVIANGFYSAINDVRAAAALAQVENVPQSIAAENITTTTTLSPELKQYFVTNEEKKDNITTHTDLKPLLGAPFTKASDSVNVSYTLVRADENQAKVNQQGAVYAGQVVEASISEDQDFNKEKASFLSKRAPIRLFAITDSKNNANAANTPKVTVVKAKIPPKSKLTFDDKTGEPILRIYASYVDPIQKEAVVSKLASLKHARDAVTRKDAMENFKASTVKSMDKSQGFDRNQVTHFGLKLRERSDDYIPLFEDYDD